jgi:membrane-associated protein
MIEFILHIDQYLGEILAQYGALTYVILFLIIFCETGLVVTPFLPGDSLLFAAGALADDGGLRIAVLFVLLSLAAILGDTVNYWAGAWIGPRVFRENVRFLNRQHLLRTREFYERHGGKTIILARFIPIIRTFAPFVAGIGTMPYARFLAYNVFGGILWVALFVFGGNLFGSLPVVEANFSLVILAIIVLSILPAVIEWLRGR